jgi:nitrate reductase cytochrome c-type subunit
VRTHAWLLLFVFVAGARVPADAQTSASPEVSPAPVFEPPDTRPGRSTRLPRTWDGQPPLVPHSLRGLTPITATSNACVRCHGRAGATSGPPPAPVSHFVDERQAPGIARPQVAGARWNCTACHVPQTVAPPLVGTTFDAKTRRPGR